MVLEISLKPFSQQVGKQKQYLFEARDITSRKLMEDKLYQRVEACVITTSSSL